MKTKIPTKRIAVFTVRGKNTQHLYIFLNHNYKCQRKIKIQLNDKILINLSKSNTDIYNLNKNNYV